MKNDVLYGNYEVITQDVNTKMQDVITCLKSLNELYSILRAVLADFVVDEGRKSLAANNLPQVWNRQDFEFNIAEADAFLEKLRQDALSAAEIQALLGGRLDSQAYAGLKARVESIASGFGEGGAQARMEEARLQWARNLSYSLQVWSEILSQRLSKATSLFEEVTELIFLSDRAFPFVLNQIKTLSEENKAAGRRSEELLSDWKDVSLFLKGLDLKLNHLEAKLEAKWVEGAKEVRRLLEDARRLKRLTSFLWGEASTSRIYQRISDQLSGLAESIQKPPGGMRNLRLDHRDLAKLAKSVFDLVVRRADPRKTSARTRTTSSSTAASTCGPCASESSPCATPTRRSA